MQNKKKRIKKEEYTHLHQGLQGVLSRDRLEPFQVEAVDSMVQCGGHFFLALDMGLGKTAVSIVALDELGVQKI